MNRCLNDIWGYCTGTPLRKRLTTATTLKDLAGKTEIVKLLTPTCRRSYLTCGRHKTHTELCQALIPTH